MLLLYNIQHGRRKDKYYMQYCCFCIFLSLNLPRSQMAEDYKDLSRALNITSPGSAIVSMKKLINDDLSCFILPVSGSMKWLLINLGSMVSGYLKPASSRINVTRSSVNAISGLPAKRFFNAFMKSDANSVALSVSFERFGASVVGSLLVDLSV